MLDISIVLVTFNSERFIIPCLDSLFAQGASGVKVIVVDNGSQDKTAGLIKNKYPQAKLIVNEHNFGPCQARNQGIDASSGEWVLTLDSDIVLEESFFSHLERILAQAPENVGMLQPKILNFDRSTVYSLGIYLSSLRRFYDIESGHVDSVKFNRSAHIFGVCSAAAIYRRKMLQEVKEETGYFDERFFFLVEDVDLAWRAQKRGWKAQFFPGAACYHYGNGSGHNKELRQYLSWRNRYYMIKKNEGLIRYFLKIYPVLFYDLPRICWLSFTNRYLFKGLPVNDLFISQRVKYA